MEENNKQSNGLMSDKGLELSLPLISRELWRLRFFLVAFVLACGGAAAIHNLRIPDYYEATSLVAPTESQGGAMSGISQQLGGLATLAGVQLGSGAGKAEIALEVLKSRSFLGKFITSRKVFDAGLPMSLDADNPTVVRPRNLDSALEDGADVSMTEFRVDSRTIDRFRKLITVYVRPKSGYVEITVRDESPSKAAELANWLVEDINAEVMRQDVEEARRSIEYLTQQISETSLTELRVIFYDLIQAQTKTMMLAEVRPEYVFKVIDPAYPPRAKAGPRRLERTVLYSFFGAMVAVLIVMLRLLLRSSGTK
jgi:uncharacterized protein involved in exopolysaccharide biosynthesis